ncbi:M9 family metallopeptidase N-terminal domain-containing protein, partial [Streptomyces sp. NPDC004976]
MRKSLVRRSLGAALPLALTITMGAGLLAQPASARSGSPVPVAQAAAANGKHTDPPPAAQSTTAETEHVAKGRQKVSALPPLAASKDVLKKSYAEHGKPPVPSKSIDTAAKGAAGKKTGAAAAACNVSDFTSRTGSALVQQIKTSTTDCVNTLFNLSGNDAYYAFREAQMATVAYAVRDGSASYPGNSTTGMPQLVLYLRAGYYVHYYNASTVGAYGSTLKTAIRSGLDAFFASPRSRDVTDANGETLAEAVTLIDSSEENARYLYVV